MSSSDAGARARQGIEALFLAILSGDVPNIQDHYLQNDDLLVFTEGPPGKVAGWDRRANAAAWRGVLDNIRFTDIHMDDDLRAGGAEHVSWAGGTIHLTYEPTSGGPSTSVSNRGTWIFEDIDGRVKIVFEHVSFPLADPYPMPQ